MKREDVKEEIARLSRIGQMSDEELIWRIEETARTSLEDFIELGPDLETIEYLKGEMARWERLANKRGAKAEEKKIALRAILEHSRELREAMQVPYRLNLAKAEESGKLPQLKKIKITSSGGVEFELHDAFDAIKTLAKGRGLLGLTTEQAQALIALALGKAPGEASPP